jgi:2-polyprenyl-3-methyl-5-hydroxy-6-metoxy-1,4-benzoquinol methylase
MLQPLEELEAFYSKEDPWDYEITPDDARRKDIILSEIPDRKYLNVLDIGCGHGFVTRDLPGDSVTGVDISKNAIYQANVCREKFCPSRDLKFLNSSIFDLPDKVSGNYDLIIITGLLYSQYIGCAKRLVYNVIDQLLVEDGILLTSHINEWYSFRFQYLMLENHFFQYREYDQRLEVYIK